MNRLCMVAALVGALVVGCAGGEGDDELRGSDESPGAAVEETAPLAVSETRYCVDQSYATVNRIPDEWMFCPTQLTETRLSQGHPVHITGNCGNYITVVSLWNGTRYFMRRDALSPC